MKQTILLLEDVAELGRSGDVVTVKAGFSRNFLLPKKKAVIARKHTLRMQEKLKEERLQKAAVDKKDSEILAEKLKDVVLTIQVKIDPDRKMYGSVSSLDIVHLLEKEGFAIEKSNVHLKHSIKELGSTKVPLKLKEGVTASFELKIIPEGEVIEEKPQEESEAKEPTQE